jgi:uncharacterized repeat protein (TIGR01451 family)
MRPFFVLGAVLLAALALQAGLMAFAMYVLIGVLILSRYLAKEWVSSVRVRREAPTDTILEIGQSIEMSVRLTNTGKVTIAWILLEDLLPEAGLRQKPPRFSIKGKRVKIGMVRPQQMLKMKYGLQFNARGYYQIGPTLLETGDLFGLHRRHRVVTKPVYVLILPKIVPLPKYDFASQRPIGEVSLAHRLFEDPTRNAGVRPYQIGDPLQRVHWRATARTGQLQCRIFDPTTLAGATLLIDFHRDSFHSRGEPYRSDFVTTVAASIAYAVTMLNQPVGLVSNGRDAADRIRTEVETQEGDDDEVASFENRDEARVSGEMLDESDRLRIMQIETRRGIEQFQKIREALARLELTDGMTFPGLILEATPRLPRDATVIAILAAVPVESAFSLGILRKQGFAVSAILIGLEDEELAKAHGRLLAAGVRDVRSILNEESLGLMGETKAPATNENPYAVDIELV